MLEQASFVGFIRTVLIILLVYYGFKIVSRLLAPYLLKYAQKKAQQRFGDQFKQYQKQQQQKQTKEGEITIDKMPNKNKSSNKDVGEYVDYEEID
ncbi:MAG: DUF4834 family protein [Flavobacteriaceae bacterium]|nr:DUF4834 family protein [Bacteroidia bacterium]NNK82066.1 DUF4834 family protein [Flavobacteriaceae bacterium]